MTSTLDEKEGPGGEKSRENWAAWGHVEPGGEEAEPGWPPQFMAKVIRHSLFVQCCYLFPPSFLAYYSDFIMLVWIMWIFTLCFDWNSRTWFRK